MHQIKVDTTGEILTVQPNEFGGVMVHSGEKVLLDLKKSEADALGAALLAEGANEERRAMIARAAGLE